jgi:hypothetical protein
MADLSPIIDSAIGMAGTALTVFGTLTLTAIAKHFNLQVSAQQTASFDDALEKSVTFGATQAEAQIRKNGWDSPDIKSPILNIALNTMAQKFPDALKGVGLSPDVGDPATAAKITAALTRAYPAAMATVAASPATPPTPVQAAMIPPPQQQ